MEGIEDHGPAKVMRNPRGLRHQFHWCVRPITSRTLENLENSPVFRAITIHLGRSLLNFPLLGKARQGFPGAIGVAV